MSSPTDVWLATVRADARNGCGEGQSSCGEPHGRWGDRIAARKGARCSPPVPQRHVCPPPVLSVVCLRWKRAPHLSLPMAQVTGLQQQIGRQERIIRELYKKNLPGGPAERADADDDDMVQMGTVAGMASHGADESGDD